jgi:hypothetical protein
MKKIATLTLGALSLVALASGCSMETMEAPPEELGTNEEALVCSNDQATFAIMASLATAMAKETRRWLPGRDLQWNYTTWKLELSQWGRARCPIVGYDSAGKAIKNCETVKELLALQDDAAQGTQLGGQPLDTGVLRNRLYSYWDRQMVCINRPDNGFGDDCPAERHDLVFSYETTSSGTCAGGKDYWYHAYYGDTMTNLSATDAAQLKNQLIWAGGTDNPFLAFDNVGGNVKVDPVDGTTGGSGSGSGSCEVATGYNPSTGKCDATNITKVVGSCCSCGGVNKTWQPKPLMTGWYVCK